MRLREALNLLKDKPYSSIAYLPGWYKTTLPTSVRHIQCNPDTLEYEVVYKDGFIGDLDSFLESRPHIKPWVSKEWEVQSA